MKTAISVADQLLVEADSAARQMGVSRSRLFSLAMENYLRKRHDKEIVEKLNHVYREVGEPDDRSTAAKMKKQFRSTIRDRW